MNKEKIINILTEELGLVNYVYVTKYLANLDTEIIMLQEENKQLKENWNKLKEYLKDMINIQEETYKKYGKNNINIYYASTNKVVLDKMEELEKGEENE